MLYTVFQMKQKIEDPLNVLDKDMNKLEGNIQRSGKIMSSMQNTVEKLRFHGHRPATEKQENVALVRRPEMQSSDMDDGCMFSGTASGKSANVKVRCAVSHFVAYDSNERTCASYLHSNASNQDNDILLTAH